MGLRRDQAISIRHVLVAREAEEMIRDGTRGWGELDCFSNNSADIH